MTEETPQKKIAAILRRQSGHDLPTEGLDGFRYIEAGVVDSMGLIEFIIELEETFDIEMEPGDTESDEFRTVGGLTRIVRSKLACQ